MPVNLGASIGGGYQVQHSTGHMPVVREAETKIICESGWRAVPEATASSYVIVRPALNIPNADGLAG